MKKLSNEFINGELSHATLLSEDLISIFMGFLHGVQKECDCKTQEYDERWEGLSGLF